MTDTNTIKLLSLSEERALIKAFREQGCTKSRDAIILAHQPLAQGYAKIHAKHGVPFNDLVNEANVGMLKAIDKYDPDHKEGARFATYASFWIRDRIGINTIGNWSMVKLGTTKPQKKVFYNLRKAQQKLGITGEMTEAEVAVVAEELGVSESVLVQMSQRMQGNDLSCNTLTSNGDADDGFDEHVNHMEDLTVNTEEDYADKDEQDYQRKTLVQAMINVLTKQEQEIMIARRVSEPKVTLQVLANRYGASIEWVRKADINAFAKVKKEALRLAEEANNG